MGVSSPDRNRRFSSEVDRSTSDAHRTSATYDIERVGQEKVGKLDISMQDPVTVQVEQTIDHLFGDIPSYERNQIDFVSIEARERRRVLSCSLSVFFSCR